MSDGPNETELVGLPKHLLIAVLELDAGASDQEIMVAIETTARERAEAVSGLERLENCVPHDEHASLAAERDQLQAANANLATELDKAVARYQVHRRKHEGKGRPIGALKASADPADIAAAVEGPVELVFSDGRKEIPAIDPVHVSGGAAWSRHPSGMMLRDRVLLAGPAPGERAFSVAGVGLLVDGKQIGWCALHDVVSVPGGATAELRDSIIF